MKKSIISLVFSLLLTSVFAQEVKVETYTFAHRGEQELKLNIYSASESVEPCLIYIFGGAFVVGSREEPTVIECMNTSPAGAGRLCRLTIAWD